MEALWVPEPGFWLLPERYPEYAFHSKELLQEGLQRPVDPNVPFVGGRRPIVVGGMSMRCGHKDFALDVFHRARKSASRISVRTR
ncbi:hypothetical protein AB4156_26175 [Cupriavidus sp. 2MCAB6]|jgi:hypothetical protein|uniref:hypothetical protein n=1 Tax=unclassified Cupriavidus TaxID=2640874 RepID=UPI0005EB511B|nr:hypothetical protein UB46_23010 [Burkholderiaceae bacterium 16]